MSNNIYEPIVYLGPLKVFGTSKPETFIGYRTGWFYPVYITRAEAIQSDIDRGGKGIYRVLSFYEQVGEFYMPDSYINAGEPRDPLIYTKYTGEGAENPFKRIQNKLSNLISDQLPDFVTSNYEMFVTFLKAYYEFLEQNNSAQEVLQNITKYSDIDETSEELISKFIQNYATDYTPSEISNNRHLVKKIREIYSKKGTEPAYRLMFNILYKETINFFYPWEVVLKASSGKWTTRYALRAKPLNAGQNMFDFENTEVIGKDTGAKGIVNKVIKISIQGNDVYEFIMDTTSLKGEFSNTEEVYASKTSLLTGRTFSITPLNAIVYSVIKKVDIKDGALGYAKNHPLIITDTTGIYAKAKVNSVNRYGSITSINILDAGINYSANTIIDAGLPTEPLNGTYSIYRGAVTVTFPKQHGMIRGKNISVYYSGNVFSPVDNTSHTASVLSVPNVRSIRFKYPGF